MKCPKGCDFTMYEIDDCGDGSKGHECGLCGVVVSDGDQPCPELENGDPCFAIDNAWGGSECAYCGRDL
jgi:hypothetical protein